MGIVEMKNYKKYPNMKKILCKYFPIIKREFEDNE